MADIPRVQEQYQEEVRPTLVDQFGYENPMEVPKLKKICVNRGVGEVSENQKAPRRHRREPSDFRTPPPPPC